MVCTIAQSLAELVEARPPLRAAIVADRLRRRLEEARARRADRPRIKAGALPVK